MRLDMSDDYRECFNRWHEADQKFEYYFTGLIGAVTTYLLTQTPSSPCNSPFNFETYSLFFFCLSLVFSISGLSRNIIILRMTTELVPRQNMHAHLKTKPADEPALDPETLETVSEERFQNKLSQLKEVIDIAKHDMDKVVRKIELLSTVRNIAFLLGVACFFISKFVK